MDILCGEGLWALALLFLGLAEPAEESPWARFYGAGANAGGRAWKRDLAAMRRIDEDMWK